MRKSFKHFIFLLLCLFVLNGSADAAQQLDSMVDEFYKGLIAVIEKNMDSPESSMQAVNSYFKANRDKIEQIRQEAAKAMEKLGPEIDKYMSMTKEEAEAMQQQGNMAGRQPTMSAVMRKYNEVFKSFYSRCPDCGMKLAGKTMQLMPGSGKSPQQAGAGIDTVE